MVVWMAVVPLDSQSSGHRMKKCSVDEQDAYNVARVWGPTNPKPAPKCHLLQRLLVGGTVLERGSIGELVGSEYPVAWDGGAPLDEKIYLVRFENVDPGRGPVKIWLLDEQVFILDGEHKPWESKP